MNRIGKSVPCARFFNHMYHVICFVMIRKLLLYTVTNFFGVASANWAYDGGQWYSGSARTVIGVASHNKIDTSISEFEEAVTMNAMVFKQINIVVDGDSPIISGILIF